MTYKFQELYETVRRMSSEHYYDGSIRDSGKWIYKYAEIEGEPRIMIKTKLVGVTFKSDLGVYRSDTIVDFLNNRWEKYDLYLSQIFGENRFVLPNKITPEDFKYFTQMSKHESDSVCRFAEGYIKVVHEKDNPHDCDARKVFCKNASLVVHSWKDIGYLPEDLATFMSYIRGSSILNFNFHVFTWRPISKRNLELFITTYLTDLPRKELIGTKKNELKFLSLKELRKRMEVK